MQQYKVEHNKVNFILPAFTRKVKSQIDDVNEKISDMEISLDDRIEAMQDFLRNIIGEETLSKVLGSEDPDEVDLNDLNILYLKVTKEYDKPVQKFNKPVLDAETKKMLQEVTAVANSIKTVNSIPSANTSRPGSCTSATGQWVTR